MVGHGENISKQKFLNTAYKNGFGNCSGGQHGNENRKTGKSKLAEGLSKLVDDTNGNASKGLNQVIAKPARKTLNHPKRTKTPLTNENDQSCSQRTNSKYSGQKHAKEKTLYDQLTKPSAFNIN